MDDGPACLNGNIDVIYTERRNSWSGMTTAQWRLHAWLLEAGLTRNQLD